jgi:hypothetical protein
MSWQVKISENATVQDTVNLIRQTVNKYADSQVVKNLVKKLQAESTTKENFLENLFSFACKHVSYLRDETGHEKVYTPERLLREGRGDCKKFSTLIGATLKKAGFNPILKIVSYDGKTWAHIYIIVPLGDGRAYITLDPVNKCMYNKEVNHRKAWLHSLKGENMELSLLGRLDKNAKPMFSDLRNDPKFLAMCYRQHQQHRGRMIKNGKQVSLLGAAADLLNEFSEISGAPVSELLEGESIDNLLAGLSGGAELNYMQMLGYAPESLANEEILLGAWGSDELGAKKKGARKKRKSKIWNFLKKIGLAPARIAFLGMVRINLFGLAKKLYKSIKKDKGARLFKFWRKLGGSIKKLTKAVNGGVKRLIKKGKLKGLGVAPLIAVFAAAVPIVTALIPLLKKQGVVTPENPQDVKFVQEADKAESNLEKKIDSGEAAKYVQEIKTDSRLNPPASGGGGSSDGTQYANQQDAAADYQAQPEPDGEGHSLEGLGAFDFAALINSVKNVVKSPTFKTAVSAVVTMKSVTGKIKNPKTRGYVNQVINRSEQLINTMNNPKTTGIQKKTAGQSLKNLLTEAAQVLPVELPASLEKRAGGYSGGTLLEKFLKIGVGVGYVQTFYGDSILNFLQTIIK